MSNADTKSTLVSESSASSAQMPAAAVSSGAGLPVACPDDMVYVPAGELRRAKGAPVHLDAFYIDRTEVTVVAFRTCVDAKKCAQPLSTTFGCTYPDRKDHYPVTCVDFIDAKDYCRFADKAVPTLDEWEYAAHRSSPYTWGTEPPSDQLCWSGGPAGSRQWKGSCEVGTNNGDTSWVGAVDMEGNAAERVASDCAKEKNDMEMLVGDSWETALPRPAIGRIGNCTLATKTNGPWVGIRCARKAPLGS